MAKKKRGSLSLILIFLSFSMKGECQQKVTKGPGWDTDKIRSPGESIWKFYFTELLAASFVILILICLCCACWDSNKDARHERVGRWVPVEENNAVPVTTTPYNQHILPPFKVKSNCGNRPSCVCDPTTQGGGGRVKKWTYKEDLESYAPA